MSRSDAPTSRTPVAPKGRKRKFDPNGHLDMRRKPSRGSGSRPGADTNKNIKALELAAVDGGRGVEAIEQLLSKVRLQFPYTPVNIEVVLSLCRVYTRLLAAGGLSKTDLAAVIGEEGAASSRLVISCRQFHRVLEQLLQVVDGTTQLTVLHCGLHMLKEEAQNCSEKFWTSGIFLGFFNAITSAEYAGAIQEEFAAEYLSKYQDLCYHFANAVGQSATKIDSKIVLEGAVTILSGIKMSPKSADEVRLFGLKPKKYKITTTSLKRKVESAWLVVLNAGNLDDGLRKRLLGQCTSAILPWMTRPEGLMDFLTDSYDLGGSMSLIALSGLFKLINEKNLDYPSFYPKLYSLLDTELLHSKHRSRFLRLLKQFLNSTHLPASLVASFIKRLARLSLFAPPAAIVAIVPHIYNLLKEHPTCTFMVHRKPYPPCTRTKQHLGHDPFDMAELDPQQTGAIDSSLWELETLQSHYHPNVASLAKIIGEQFTKGAYNLEDFLDHGYGSMMDSELGKEAKKPPVVEWRIPKHFLTKPPDAEEQDETQLNLVQQLWDFT